MSKRTGYLLILIIAIVLLSGCKTDLSSTMAVPDQERMEKVETALTTPAGPPAVSEGGKIVFYSDRKVQSDIYIMAVDGSGLQRLTDDPADDVGPAISPDGNLIVFSSKRDGNFELYLMGSDGSNLNRLTDTAANELHPTFSSDGQLIVYTVYTSSEWDDGDIFSMDLDGTNSRQLTDDPTDDMLPDISPDDSMIYFSSKREGNYEIYRMDIDGKNQTRLTTSEQNELSPQISPDGRKLAFSVVDFFMVTAVIRVMDLNDGTDILLADNGSVNENAMWSPEGGYLVFQTSRDGNYEVYIMDADGSNQRRLTNERTWDGWAGWGR
jgi:TolB protein